MRPQSNSAIFFYLLQEVVLRSVSCDPVQHDLTQILTLVNSYRSTAASAGPRLISNMNKLEWSSILASRAQESVSCRSHRRGQLGVLGEVGDHVNVGRKRSRPTAFASILRDWYNENHYFDTEEGACYPWDICTQYMNMINAKHRTMGCAYVQNCGRRNNSVVLMCIFEGGNQYMFDFEHGDVCTGCTDTSPFCSNSLCVSCNASRDECECTKTCRRRNIGIGQLDATTCTCSCQFGLGPNCDRPCRNPGNIDYDDGIDYVCQGLTQQDCLDPVNIEFCPEQCSCSPMPAGLQHLT